MKNFMRLVIGNVFTIKNNLLVSLCIPVLLWAIPLQAGNNYLFPSDITDQSEQAVYDTERANRYASQRTWAYPENNSLNPNHQGRQTYNEDQYITIDGQASPYQMQPEYDHSNFNNAERSKNIDYDSGRVKNYRSVNKVPELTQPNIPQYNTSSGSTGMPAYTRKQYQGEKFPGEKYADDFGNRMYEQTMEMGQTAYPGNTGTRNKATYYRRMNSNLLYPGDVEPVNRFLGKSNEIMQYQPPVQTQQPKQKNQIQYVPVPVPVYRVPGTLPGTVPGLITPSNMVPGYSHLSPYNNYGSSGYGSPNYGSSGYGSPNFGGLNNPFGMPYNSAPGFGTFPGMGMGNPFGNTFNNYGNNPYGGSPFTMPGLMGPGFFQ